MWRIASVLAMSCTTTAIAAGCSISAQEILFGSYDVFSPIAAVTSSELTIDCATAQTVAISISAGGAAGSPQDRRMTLATHDDRLAYNLFLDATMMQVWGDGAFGATFSGRVEGRLRLRVFAQIYPGQDVRVGSYSDTVRVVLLP